MVWKFLGCVFVVHLLGRYVEEDEQRTGIGIINCAPTMLPPEAYSFREETHESGTQHSYFQENADGTWSSARRPLA